MRVKILYLLCLSILSVVPAVTQTKSVTNADLEKFRQKRVQVEKDYRENYAKLGFPSPEELDRQIEKSRVERETLAARLTAERLQREQAEAARIQADRYSEESGYYVLVDSILNDRQYYSAYTGKIFYGRRFPRFRPIYNNHPVIVGNGMPTGNYFTYLTRPVRPSSQWLRP